MIVVDTVKHQARPKSLPFSYKLRNGGHKKPNKKA